MKNAPPEATRPGNPRRSRLPALLASGLLAAYLIPLVPELAGRRLLIFRDAFITHWPLKLYSLDLLRHGIVPFVNRAASNGEPLLGNPNSVALYPDNLLYFVLPPAAAFNMHLILHVVWAFFGASRLCRRLGASRPAAMLGAAVFAYSGLMLSFASSFTNSAAAAAWAPWVIEASIAAGMAAARADRRGLTRGAVAVGCAAGLQALAGEPAISALTLLLAVALALAFSRRHARPGALTRFGVAAAAATLLGASLAMPLLLTARQFVSLSFRFVHPYSAGQAAAAPLTAVRFLEWLLPLVFGDPGRVVRGAFWAYASFGGYWPYVWSVAIGSGTLLLLAGALTTAAYLRSRRVWLAAGLGALGLALAFGRSCPLFRVLLWLPALRRLRFPIKAYLVTELAIAVLAALAADQWVRRKRPTAAARGIVSLVCVAAVSVAAATVAFPDALLRVLAPLAAGNAIPAALVVPGVFPRIFQDALCALAACAALLFAGSAQLRRGARFGLLGLAVALTLLPAGLPLFVSGQTRTFSEVPGLAPETARHGRLFQYPSGSYQAVRYGLAARIPSDTTAALSAWGRRELWPITAAPFGVTYSYDHDPDGSFSALDRYVSEQIGIHPERFLKLLSLAGVNCLLVPRGLLSGPPEGFVHAGSFPYGLRPMELWIARERAPLIRLATRAWTRRSPAAALRLVESPEFHTDTDVVFAGTIDQDPSGMRGLEDAATHLEDRVVSLRFNSDSPVPAYAVVALTDFPYWRARVDGQEAVVRLANINFLAVPVPAGRHRVEIFYDAGPFERGVALGLIGILGALIAVFPRRKRSEGRTTKGV
jgi:hypothetical protein